MIISLKKQTCVLKKIGTRKSPIIEKTDLCSKKDWEEKESHIYRNDENTFRAYNS